MRNELAREYNLPDRADGAVALEFLGNSVRDAWRVKINVGNHGVMTTGATPRQAYAKAYSLYLNTKD